MRLKIVGGMWDGAVMQVVDVEPGQVFDLFGAKYRVDYETKKPCLREVKEGE